MTAQCDLVIVGSGIAALRAAIELAGAGEIVILTKAESAAGSTGYAQGGIAAAIGADDSPARHAADTIAAGDGLCNEEAVQILVEEGPRYVRELMAWGAAFDRGPDGELALAREGAHSVRRVLHARDATGRAISRALWQRVAATPALAVMEHALATDLIVADGRVAGVRFLDQAGQSGSIGARAVLLATGGAGQVFRETTNPTVASGDGMAMAYRVGARLADLEFVQFHPTVCVPPAGSRFLLSEALRGEGARLVNSAGEAFMTRYDPAGDLAPRDRVARSIVREAEATGAGVFLSLRHLPEDFVRERFPSLSDMCRRAGFDLARDPIPVGPAAHYVMGGVATDLEGRTSLPALFAAGEVACTGVHGANRLASNSLLEGLVFGARAGAAMRRWIRGTRSSWDGGAAAAEGLRRDGAGAPTARAWVSETEVRDLMWRRVGLFRERAGLEEALRVLHAAGADLQAGGFVRDAARVRLASLVTVGCLITRAALRREESRGAHFRSDFPARNDIDWKRHLEDSREHEDAA